MGIVSDIAIESTVKVIVEKIKEDIEKNSGNLEVCIALKEVGRFSLGQFEWSTPDWATEYMELFKE